MGLGADEAAVSAVGSPNTDVPTVAFIKMCELVTLVTPNMPICQYESARLSAKTDQPLPLNGPIVLLRGSRS